jgi:hypothetical protein
LGTVSASTPAAATSTPPGSKLIKKLIKGNVAEAVRQVKQESGQDLLSPAAPERDR